MIAPRADQRPHGSSTAAPQSSGSRSNAECISSTEGKAHEVCVVDKAVAVTILVLDPVELGSVADDLDLVALGAVEVPSTRLKLHGLLPIQGRHDLFRKLR